MRAANSRTSTPLDLSPVSFLVIDDQPYTRRLVRSILVGFGSREIYESANGVEAIELVRTAAPNIIITDLIMPNFNGLNLIRMMREPQSPAKNIPIIVLSGYLTKSAAIVMKDCGADELLVKPVSPKALYAHVARIVTRNSALQPRPFLQKQNKKGPPDGSALPNGIALV
jgi:two-component system, chemotaxis family, chemotaxis protein CheY